MKGFMITGWPEIPFCLPLFRGVSEYWVGSWEGNRVSLGNEDGRELSLEERRSKCSGKVA
jgi:hypothetical protein